MASRPQDMMLDHVSMSELVAIFNYLTGEQVKRFSDRPAAHRRVQAALDAVGARIVEVNGAPQVFKGNQPYGGKEAAVATLNHLPADGSAGAAEPAPSKAKPAPRPEVDPLEDADPAHSKPVREAAGKPSLADHTAANKTKAAVDPEARRRAAQEMWSRPGFREHMREVAKRQWANKEARAKIHGGIKAHAERRRAAKGQA